MNDKTHLTETKFTDFDLTPEILTGLQDCGFIQCTPIQAETLPPTLSGKDVAGQAQTGTGKTAAFLLALLNRLCTEEPKPNRQPNQPRALILAPTRELVVQIERDAEALANHTGFKITATYGGTGYEQQRQDISNGVDILIGTPGRLIDYFKQGVYNLKALDVLVLDEADRMFDLGFIKDIRYLLRRCPPAEQRLSMLFSATLSLKVSELAYEHMNNPESVKIETDQITADNVTETGYMTANDEKIPLLIGLLKKMENARSIIFVNTKRAADEVWGFLQGNGFETAILTGDVPQKKRLSLLKDFTDGKLSILVATDVAARGLHISGVSHVINYDLPDDPEDYVHRIGRTARAGATGDAISFVCETHAFSLPDVEAYIEHSIPISSVTSDLLVEIDPSSRVRRPKRKPLPNHKPGNSNRRRHSRTSSGGNRNKK